MQNTNDRVVMALPWFNLFGQCIGILSMAMLGGTLILLDGFNPATMAQAIAQEKATLYAGVPAMHIALLNYPKLGEYDLSSLRAGPAAGPLPGGGDREDDEDLRLPALDGFGSNEGYLNVTELGMAPALVSTTMGTRQLHSEIQDHRQGRLPPGGGGDRGVLPEGAVHHGRLLQAPDLNKKKFDEEGFYHSGGRRLPGRARLLPLRQPHRRHHHPLGHEHQRRDVESVLYRHPRSSTPPWWACRPRSRASGSAPTSS